jgi:hypothetical protein
MPKPPNANLIAYHPSARLRSLDDIGIINEELINQALAISRANQTRRPNPKSRAANAQTFRKPHHIMSHAMSQFRQDRALWNKNRRSCRARACDNSCGDTVLKSKHANAKVAKLMPNGVLDVLNVLFDTPITSYPGTRTFCNSLDNTHRLS